MRLLCLSDIHGHEEALSAVLATGERRGYDLVLVAGDLCFPGPQPLAVWRRLSQIGARCVQGVGDRALATIDVERLRPKGEFEKGRLARLLAVRQELGGRILGQLAKLPQVSRHTVPGGQLVLVHGCPRDPTEPMTFDMSDEMLAHLCADEPATAIICGGSHVPFDRTVMRQPEGGCGSPETAPVRIINVGSVGEAPGGEDRAAHVTFIACEPDGMQVEQIAVPLARTSYDLGAARQ